MENLTPVRTIEELESVLSRVEEFESMLSRVNTKLEEIKCSVDTLNNSNQLLLKKLGDTNQQDDILSFKEGCAFLNIAEATGYAKVSKREVPFMKRGKFIYFSRKMLEAYLHSGRKKTLEELEVEAKAFPKHPRRK
jgi:Helix-turn-helix domain